MQARPPDAEPRPVLLDVDTGIDDMVALLIAATAPELNLRGVTCVAGNVEIHHVARNTGKILRMVGRGDVPVSIGAARPLHRRLRTAQDTHGPTGTGYVELTGEDPELGSTDYTAIPAPRYIAAHIEKHPGELTVVALGPLTNLASAALNGVDLAGGLREAIWMGGAIEERGNTTETGEWNACVDPEAAEACLRRRRASRASSRSTRRRTSSSPSTTSTPCPIPRSRRSSATPIRFYVAFHRSADGVDGCYLHDPVTLIGSLLRPDLVTESISQALACDTGSDPHLAGSLYRLEDGARRPVEVAMAIDPEPMKAELLARLARAVANPTQ